MKLNAPRELEGTGVSIGSRFGKAVSQFSLLKCMSVVCSPWGKVCMACVASFNAAVLQAHVQCHAAQ